jgi:SET domain-containing protein
MQRVFVAPTGRTGRGLFANMSFSAGQTILVIKGTIRSSTYDSKYRIGPRWIGIADRTWLEPERGSDASYLNHSCDANAVITASMSLVAIVPVRTGQEICIDYSTTEADPHWKMACKCGTRHCRGIIRSVQSLPAEIYERYHAYLAPFVQRPAATPNEPPRH